MSDYVAPGVYVGEINTEPRPIEAVSTTTAGFAGQTERGPLLPRLITSWEEFCRWYGGYIDRPSNDTTCKYLPYAVRGFFDNDGQRAYIARVVPVGATVATLTLPGEPGATLVTSQGPGTWGNNIVVRITPASLAKSNSPTSEWFRMTLLYYRDAVPNPFVDPTDISNSGNLGRVNPDVIEDYDNLSVLSTDSNFSQLVVNATSTLITLTAGGRPNDVAFPNARLANGTFGAADPTEDQYRGSAADPVDTRTGLLGLASIRDVSLLAIPDDVVLPILRSDMLQQCTTLRDRFAILSATDNEQAGDLSQLMCPQDSSYGAYDLPWVRVPAAHRPEGHLLVPPTGHLAGIYARVDAERGVHKAPANEVVRGIITRDHGGEYKPLKYAITRREQEILNPRAINVIRDFGAEGRDIRVWGARTMSSDPELKYVNVRRLLIFLEQSIDLGTKWTVFEPNYEKTWAVIRLSITAFLRTVWRDGALFGQTANEAFFVKCDRSTMTQDDLENGRLVCLVGVAPVKPSEFVILRISQKTVEAAP
jgi:phage tail sheath protein FI